MDLLACPGSFRWDYEQDAVFGVNLRPKGESKILWTYLLRTWRDARKCGGCPQYSRTKDRDKRNMN